MKVKLMKVLSTQDLNAEFFGVKIQLTPRRTVFVADSNKLFTTKDKEKALIKLNEVQKLLDSDQGRVDFLLENKKIKVAVF